MTCTVWRDEINCGCRYESGVTAANWIAQTSSGSGAGHEWYCIASSADGLKLAAGTYNGYIYTSSDAGVTWTQRSISNNWIGISVSADGTKMAACSGGSGDGVIYTSNDSGVTWVARAITQNWRDITSSSNGSKLIACAAGGYIYTSADSGVTWVQRDSVRSWLGVASSADGTKLVACATGGYIYTSADSGVTWIAGDTSGIWYGVASSESGYKLAAIDITSYVFTSEAPNDSLVKDFTAATVQPTPIQVWHEGYTKFRDSYDALLTSAGRTYFAAQLTTLGFVSNDGSPITASTLNVPRGQLQSYSVYYNETAGSFPSPESPYRPVGWVVDFGTERLAAGGYAVVPEFYTTNNTYFDTPPAGINITVAGYYEAITLPPYQVPANIIGWNGSASSAGSFAGNGNAQFSILPSSSGVVAGLVRSGNETGSAYATIEYAIHGSQGFYQVVESGVPKTPLLAFTANQVFTIQKQDTEVEYLLDGVIVYKSLIASSGALTMALDASLYCSGDTINNVSIASGVSVIGWKTESAIYVANGVFVGNETATGTFTGTGGAGGTGAFTGIKISDTNYTGTLTGTLTGTSTGDHTGTFTGTYNLVDGVWVFTSDTGFTWGSTGTFVSSSGSQTGTFTGTVLIGGVPTTGTFTGTLITYDGGLTWAFTGTGGDTGASVNTPVSSSAIAVIPPPVPEIPDNVFYEALLDVVRVSDTVAPQSQYTLTLTDTIQYSDYINTGKGVYLALSYSPENQSVTTYSNMSFDSSCIFNGKTLFANGSGLFEYGGLTDNGTAIVPSIKTGKMDTILGRNGVVHSNKIKRIPNAKIKVSCDKTGGTLDLYVTTNNDAPDHYGQAISHNGFATHDVKIGRGTKFNFIALEITAHGCSKLDINNIEYDVVENVRSER